MTSAEYGRLKDIVADALALPESDRAAYVEYRCGVDAEAFTEARALLAAAIEAAALYEEPTFVVDGAALTLNDVKHGDDGGVLLEVPPARLVGPVFVDDGFAGTERYAVRRRIGAGGMGVVYEVDDRERGQIAALKTLRRRSSDDIYQLKREFRNLADVSHPNLVSLYELVVDGEHCFFTMELVEGLTFVEYVRDPSSSVTTAERIRAALPQLIDGVEALHRRGMHHRDIKPSNVLVTPAGRVVILDFGLTSALLREGSTDGEIAGTPAYLSPEQCRGAALSNASDWYSVGATLYHALTGRLPFDGPLRDVVERKTREDPPPASAVAPDVPADLNDICMGLLRRDPEARISGLQALGRLSTLVPGASGPGDVDRVFVGREYALSVLSAGFANARAGRSTAVVVYGPSGIGKSAVVQCFLDKRLAGEDALVLRSRCHEHEWIPYNAVDGLIDGITRHLSTLPSEQRRLALPADAPALARLFPVLQATGIGPGSPGEMEDAILLRRKAFDAFRNLLARLASRQPVVLDIDDFHWADADSVTWLTELLRGPSDVPVLVLVSFRSEEFEAKPFLRSLIERTDIGERLPVPLGPLSDDDVFQLVAALLRASDEAAAVHHADIARDSGGNPFLVEALARDLALGAGTRRGATVDEMLTRRLESLPAESYAFLRVLAICGRPVRPARIFQACGFAGDERPLLARLRAAHLVRNSRARGRVEMYHDRIREALAARVPDDAARQIHRVMANVLLEHGDDDPEALFEHYRGAGEIALAAAQAAAAAIRANEVLAFDFAATFYRHALDLQPQAQDRREWALGLARALENAGRPVEAAAAYLHAASESRGTSTIELRRKAAELLLIGGQIDEGLRVIADVLSTVGVRLAPGHTTALASLALRRLQLRLRGLDFAARPESQIAHDELLRIDACWSITAGLAMVDPIRAADFNVRQLLWALDVGDPYRVARALALEGGFSVIIPLVAGAERGADLSRRAKALAGEGEHYVAALTSVWAGIGAFLTGRWTQAMHLCGRAVTILRDECTGVTWELNLAQNFYLFSLVYRGELRDAARRLPGLLLSARERGNFYLELELSTRMSLVWLAADAPDEAERRANEGMARWSQRGFQRPHYHHFLTLVQTRLYRGRPREAWDLVRRHRRALRQSLFQRVQHTRIEAATVQARCALAMAAAGDEARRMCRIAARDATRILHENMPWANPFARLIEAGVAYQGGATNTAARRLTEATDGFTAADMHLYAAVSRRRLGTVVGGSSGRALRAEADEYLASQEVRNPAALARVIAPGLPD